MTNSVIDLCNQNTGFLQALLTLIYVLTTIGLAAFAWRSNKLAQKNIQVLSNLEIERTRPYVTFEFYQESPIVCFKLTNRGQTSALDVSITTNPRIRLLLGGAVSFPKEKTEKDLAIIEHGVSSLAPGQEISGFVGSFDRVRETNPTLIYECALKYRSSSGRNYEELIQVDLRYTQGLMHLDRKTIHHVAKELEEIRRELNHLATGFSKPHVLTQDVADHRAEQDEYIRQMEAERQKEKGDTPELKK
jgi:hypothetical protein